MSAFLPKTQQQRTALSAFALGEIMAKWRRKAREFNDAASNARQPSADIHRARAKERLDCLYELIAECEK